LQEEYGIQAFEELVPYLYEKFGEKFFAMFRGSFSGAFYDKKAQVWLFYTNHVGDKPLFYYINENKIAVASSVNYIADSLKLGRVDLKIKESAIYDLLTYGFMASGKGCDTLVEGIQRLKAGYYIRFDCKEGKTEVLNYHRFTNTKFIDETISEEQIIEELDIKFRNAISLQFEKDKEYGYKSLSSLSGGFDSRMTTWVGSVMGYDMLNLTFAQSGYLDETIACDIANYLNNEWIFKSLNDAKFTNKVEQVVEMNYGLSFYMGVAHSLSMEQYIDFDSIGIWHTGQIGDVVISSFCNKENAYEKIKKVKGTNSRFLSEKLEFSNFDEYENEEIFLMYTRAFDGALCSQIAHANYTEMMSPFLDVDFLEFCLSIPVKYREKHKLYFKWVLKKYPEAAKFRWEAIDARITQPRIIQMAKLVLRKGPYKLARILGIKYLKKDLNSSMNPFNYWYDTKPYVKNFMDGYMEEGMKIIKVSDELKHDINYLYEKGNAREKSQAMTAIAGIKRYQ